MKKYIFTLVAMCFMALLWAQAPQKLNYQGVVRDASGNPVLNQAIGLRLTIQDASNTALYQETHSVTTNGFGLYNVVIGSGTVITGTMTNVSWLTGERFIKVEMDVTGGTSYTEVGTPISLNSVPYALAANGVQATSNGGAGLVGTTASSLWWGFYENGIYRGYLGSYSGKNEDVDIGTGGGNTEGSFHITIAATPKLTVDSIGRVGIGTRFPKSEIDIKDAFGGTTRLGDNGGWTHVGMSNTASGPYNAIANGGSYLSFLYAANPSASLNSKMLMDGSGNVFRPTNDNVMALGGSGYRWTAVYASNGTIQTSDERYKTNIHPLTTGLNTVMKLNPISYNWKDKSLQLGTGVNYGFSAQELAITAPDLVIHTTTPADAETGKVNSDYPDAYGVKYAEFTPILVKAIQEQQAIIEQLTKKVTELEKKIGSK